MKQRVALDATTHPALPQSPSLLRFALETVFGDVFSSFLSNAHRVSGGETVEHMPQTGDVKNAFVLRRLFEILSETSTGNS
jgi:hypothetical protein